jgi:hypothetical protein
MIVFRAAEEGVPTLWIVRRVNVIDGGVCGIGGARDDSTEMVEV